MADYRLARRAQADLQDILEVSVGRWGDAARLRYATLLRETMKRAAGDPFGFGTVGRDDLMIGLRSLHTRFGRPPRASGSVKNPVHIVFFRSFDATTIEIVRILHDRMDPTLHIEGTK